MSFRNLMSIVKGASRNGVITPLLDMHLLERNKPKEPDGFIHPSSLPPFEEICPRALALQVFAPLEKWPAEEIAQQHSSQTHRIFENGTVTHRRYQAALIEMGICDPRVRFGWEVPIEIPKLVTRGHADAVIFPDAYGKNKVEIIRGGLANGELPINTPDGGYQYRVLDTKSKQWHTDIIDQGLAGHKNRAWKPHGEPVLVEIKSINDYGWGRLTEPKPMHVGQANLYAGFLKKTLYPALKRIAFLYENKNDQTIKEYVVDVDVKLFNRYCEVAKVVFDAGQKKVLPKKICKNAAEGEARDCSWVEPCFKFKTFTELVQIDAPKSKKKKDSA